MSAIFTGIRSAAAPTLATSPVRPSYAKSLNGKDHPYVIQVGDDLVVLSDLDWQL
jgi:hypothetical protein